VVDLKINKLTKELMSGELVKKRRGDVRSDRIEEFEYKQLFHAIAYEIQKEKKDNFLISSCNRINTAKLFGEAILGLEQTKINILDMGFSNTTPLTSKTRKYLGVSGAMITASHQPPSYNGVKLELASTPHLDRIKEIKEKSSQIANGRYSSHNTIQ